jgi:fucose permease
MIQVSPGVIAQDLMKDFNIHATSLGNLSAYYFYSYASMQLVAGMLLDSWGPRKLLSISATVCSIGCFLFSTADTLLYAELSRFIIVVLVQHVLLSALLNFLPLGFPLIILVLW